MVTEVQSLLNLIITLIYILNPTGSATSSCLSNTEKLGTKKATEKIRSRHPGEIWITLLAIDVERKATMMVTVNATLKSILKRIWRHSGIVNRKKFQQAPWWRRPKSVGKRQRGFVKSHDGTPH